MIQFSREKCALTSPNFVKFSLRSYWSRIRKRFGTIPLKLTRTLAHLGVWRKASGIRGETNRAMRSDVWLAPRAQKKAPFAPKALPLEEVAITEPSTPSHFWSKIFKQQQQVNNTRHVTLTSSNSLHVICYYLTLIRRKKIRSLPGRVTSAERTIFVDLRR